MNYIGIDIGTSFIKGAILDLETRQLRAVRRRPFPDPIADQHPYFFAVNPHDLLATMRSFIAELAALAQCDGVVMCSQMHGLILTDAEGAPCSDLITWRDQRAVLPHPDGQGSYYDHLRAELSPTDIAELGNGLRTGLPIGTLYWMREEGRLAQLLQEHERLIPMSLPDFVLASLCETSRICIEPTNAAAHGVFDVGASTWHQGALCKLGLDQLSWPDLTEGNQSVGDMIVGGQRLPCFPPVGDHQCSLLGTLLQPRELSLNISTGSQASLITQDLRFGDYEIRPYFDGRYLNTIVQAPAGRSLDALVKLLTELATLEGTSLDDPWTSIAAAVEATPETDLEVDLTFHSATGAGHGRIANIREDNLSVGHLFRASFVDMARNYANYATRLAGDRSHEECWDRIAFSGGLAQRFETLRKTILARFACGHRVAGSTEDSLMGLMVLAWHVCGHSDSVAEAVEHFTEHARS